MNVTRPQKAHWKTLNRKVWNANIENILKIRGQRGNRTKQRGDRYNNM